LGPEHRRELEQRIDKIDQEVKKREDQAHEQIAKAVKK